MKCEPRRWVRDLAPIALGPNRELRLAATSVSGSRRVTMSTWTRRDAEWHKMPGHVSIPLELLGLLRDRLQAATVDTRELAKAEP